MKSKRILIGAALASTALVLAACSTSGGTPASTATGKAAVQNITLTEIDDYIPTAVPQGKAITWLFNTYEKSHPGITIQKTGIAANELAALQAKAKTNSMPDIAMIAPQNYPALEATKMLMPLTKDLKAWGVESKYMPSAIAATKDKDGTIGAVFTGTNTVSILYNTTMFASAGIKTTPKTWTQFLADAKKLTTPSVQGFMFAGINSGCSAWQFNPWQWTAGGSDTKLADSGNVKALAFWQKLITSGASSKDVVNQCQNEGMNALVQGQAAMIENGPWSFATLNAASNLTWGSFPIPVPAVGDKLVVPLGGEVWVLPKTGDSAREKAAEAFLQWSQTPKVVTEFDQHLGYIPVMPSLWPAFQKANPQMAATIAELPGARGRTTVLGTNAPAQIAALGTAIQQVILGQKSPKDALSAAQQAFKAAAPPQ